MKSLNSTEVKCFRCLENGHHQYDCTKEPVCYKCKAKGHMAVDCKTLSLKKLQMYGFGIPDQGFYSFSIPEAKAKEAAATGLITILEGEATEERLDTELKHLVKEDWDFKVRKMDLHDYLTVFPDKSTLETFTKLSGFEMSLFGLKGKIVKSFMDPETSSVLHTVWIKIHKIPDIARDVESVKEITNLVAEPLVVDELSLIRAEPVRVKARCRNPSAIKGVIEVFFNGVGVFLRFEVEEPLGGSKRGKGGPSPGPGKPDDPHNKDSDNNYKGDKSKKSLTKFDRMGRMDREKDTNHDESMEEDLESVDSKINTEQMVNTATTPLAAFHPKVGLIDMRSKLSVGEKAEGYETSCYSEHVQARQQELNEEQILIPSESQVVVHGVDGAYLMEKDRWPKLVLVSEVTDSEPVESLTQEDPSLLEKNLFSEPISKQLPTQADLSKDDMVEEDLMDNFSCQSKDSDIDEVGQGWQTSKSKKNKRLRKTKIVVASRTSSRIPRDSIPITEKASLRASTRDNMSGFTWAIWNNRNKMAIEHKFPKSPSDIIYIALSFMQKWSLLLKEDDRQRILQVKDEIICWMKSFKPILLMTTDIGEI